MIENHPFGYYLPKNAKTLILGSFPCFNGKDYGDWFYGGSGKSDFWKLLATVFNHPCDNREAKEMLCQKNGIAITDIGSKIRRKKNNCSDSNLEIIELNKEHINGCLNEGINQVFFTSKFVQKQYLAHFSDFKIKSLVLLSPSPSANLYITSLDEYKQLIKTNKISTPFEFRLSKYKKAFAINDDPNTLEV